MNSLRVALIQVAYNPAPGAMAGKYQLLVADAAREGAKIVVLPELSLSPYLGLKPRADWGTEEPLPESIPHGDSCRLLGELAAHNKIYVLGSLYERGGLGFRKQKGARFNTAVLFDPEGNISAACRAQHVAVGTGTYETEYFGVGNSDYPVFGLPDARVAIPTGYDLWFPELARIHAMKGAELILSPSSQGHQSGDADPDGQEAWVAVLQSHAIINGVFVAATNRVGTEQGTRFFGSSVIIAPDGAVLARGSRDGEEAIIADLDPATLERWRARFPLLLRREPQTYGVLMGRLSLNTPETVTEE